jgi:hypothetical protein
VSLKLSFKIIFPCQNSDRSHSCQGLKASDGVNDECLVGELNNLLAKFLYQKMLLEISKKKKKGHCTASVECGGAHCLELSRKRKFKKGCLELLQKVLQLG